MRRENTLHFDNDNNYNNNRIANFCIVSVERRNFDKFGERSKGFSLKEIKELFFLEYWRVVWINLSFQEEWSSFFRFFSVV